MQHRCKILAQAVVVVETDLASAFQRAPRDDILDELYADSYLIDLIPLFFELYDSDSALFYDHIASMLSAEGSQQGHVQHVAFYRGVIDLHGGRWLPLHLISST